MKNTAVGITFKCEKSTTRVHEYTTCSVNSHTDTTKSKILCRYTMHCNLYGTMSPWTHLQPINVTRGTTTYPIVYFFIYRVVNLMQTTGNVRFDIVTIHFWIPINGPQYSQYFQYFPLVLYHSVCRIMIQIKFTKTIRRPVIVESLCRISSAK